MQWAAAGRSGGWLAIKFDSHAFSLHEGVKWHDAPKTERLMSYISDACIPADNWEMHGKYTENAIEWFSSMWEVFRAAIWFGVQVHQMLDPERLHEEFQHSLDFALEAANE